MRTWGTCLAGLAIAAVLTASPALAGPALARPAPGSPGNPLVVGCGAEATTPTPVPQRPQPGDLSVGPLWIPGGRALATANPKGYGTAGRYKVPFAVKMGAHVTVTILPPAWGTVVLDNPYSTVGGVSAITYHACAHLTSFFPQSFAFRGRRTRGCIPLGVRIGHAARAHRLVLSLFAGRCQAA
ncbi:MAG: hypothetical protein ACRDZX_15190 [Acidimicrobiales bacterium]